MIKDKSSESKLGIFCRISFSELCILFVIVYLYLIFSHESCDSPNSTAMNVQNEKTVHKPTETKTVQNSQVYLNYSENPAIIIWYSMLSDRHTFKCGNFSCDIHSSTETLMLPPKSQGAYYFYGSLTNLHYLPLPRDPENVVWALQHEESPKNVLQLMHESVLKLFNYSSTFSRYSDVPYPLHYMGSLGQITSMKYFVKTSIKNLALKKISPILYMQTSCKTQTSRDEFVKKLMKYQKIDSYGACLNNKPLPEYLEKLNSDYINNINTDPFLKFMANYKFMITIENGVCDDYITEKFWRAIHIGVVPIYYGAPTIRDWLPNNKSALLIEDFPTVELLSARINTLLKHDDLYEEYLQHKTMGLISNQRIIDEIKARPYQIDDPAKDSKFLCYICEKLHEKDKKVQMMNVSHYNCPEPRPLVKEEEQSLQWKGIWLYSKEEAEKTYYKVKYNK